MGMRDGDTFNEALSRWIDKISSDDEAQWTTADLRQIRGLVRERNQLARKLDEIRKHVESVLDNVNDQLSKETSMAKGEQRTARVKRSTKLKLALSQQKSSLRQIQSIIDLKE